MAGETPANSRISFHGPMTMANDIGELALVGGFDDELIGAFDDQGATHAEALMAGVCSAN